MRGFCKMRKWLRLPSRIGLLVGLGALSAAGARADIPAVTQASYSPGLGELLIRVEAGRIYISEGGRDFRELLLGDTADAHLLRELLAGTDGTAIPLHPLILAGAGGDGFAPGGHGGGGDLVASQREGEGGWGNAELFGLHNHRPAASGLHHRHSVELV